VSVAEATNTTGSPLVPAGASPPGRPGGSLPAVPPCPVSRTVRANAHLAAKAAGRHPRRRQAEACHADAHPAFADRSAKALLREAGAVCRSALVPAPFPQARSPFEVFPSSTAVPRHRGPLPSRRFRRRHRSSRACCQLALPPGRAFTVASPCVPRALLRERVRCDVSAVALPPPGTPLGFTCSSHCGHHPSRTPAACRQLPIRRPTARAAARMHTKKWVRTCHTRDPSGARELASPAADRGRRQRPREPRPRSKPAVAARSSRRLNPSRCDVCPGASTRVDPACGPAPLPGAPAEANVPTRRSGVHALTEASESGPSRQRAAGEGGG